jgi:2-keto-4-pentenoate hydratase/2-oxohepta-3-ene-1,7-dioic acid hydratase in catechol pathway
MKLLCIGRNYAAHAAELQNDLPAKPVVFLKPATAILASDTALHLPAFSQDVQYECELVFRVGQPGRHITEADAMDHLDAVTVGLDFTARDLQAELKQQGLPWELAKAWDGSAALGQWQPLVNVPTWPDLPFALHIDGQLRQTGDPRLTLFSLPYLVAFLSEFFTLQPGDLIFTGTPAGVGPLQSGQTLVGSLCGNEVLRVKVA